MITDYTSKDIVAVLDSKRQPPNVGRQKKGLYYLDPVSGKYITVDGLLNIPVTKGFKVEVDFGSTPLSEKTFSITNSSVSESSVIIAQVANEKPTGKDLDEIEMDDFDVKVRPDNGKLFMTVSAVDGSLLADRFKVNYQLWQ